MTQTIASVLDGFGPVVWINLDRSTDRRAFMEDLFQRHCITDTHRVPGIDGNDAAAVYELVGGEFAQTRSKTTRTIACFVAHLTAIRYFLENLESDHAIICEDDLSFETVQYWRFTWNEFVADLPPDWNLIQLCILQQHLALRLVEHQEHYWGAQSYMISRAYAQQVIDRFHRDGIYRVVDHPSPVADEALYEGERIYSFPLFVEHQFKSLIHSEHEAIHATIRENTLMLWQFYASVL